MPSPNCALCGAPVRPPHHAPAPETAPDLDMRPGEPTRSTLPGWVATCPQCGACAPDLATLPAAARAIVSSPEYQHLAGPEEVVAFLRWAMICEGLGHREEAGEAKLQAAWAADDAADIAASKYRRDAVALWGEARDAPMALRIVDLLRRAGDFPAAAAAADRAAALTSEESALQVLAYQRRLIAARDMGRHLISSAVRPPAATPHVAHGRIAAGRTQPGFWKRLLGGA